MIVYRGWEEGIGNLENVSVALGNFDGVHLGHRQLIEAMTKKAKEIKGTSLVFTFYPHPSAVLTPHNAPPMLLSQTAKQKVISELGVDILVRTEFTRNFAQMSPEVFVRQIIRDSLRARWVFIGYNYNFGHKGQGTPELLEELGKKYGFEVHIIPPVKVDGQTVSSTLIRNLLHDGNVIYARKFLGYYPFIEGKVVLGDKRGRELGFPTANVDIEDKIMVPANGVYSVSVQVDEDEFVGVANVGVKPTFHGNDNKKNVEVHLLDFYGELYGKDIKVCFKRRLRGEKQFNSVAELVRQIEQDVCTARAEME